MTITLDYDTFQEMEKTIKGLRAENEKLREDHDLIIVETKRHYWQDSKTGKRIEDIKVEYLGENKAIIAIIEQKDKVIQRFVDRNNEVFSRGLIARILNK